MSARPLDESARRLARIVDTVAQPLGGGSSDFDAIVGHARHARYVLIGEASHGTHEFYRIRAELTKRLLNECGFTAVAIEGDWPDAYRVNRYVRGFGPDVDATEALGGFRRFPQWMWRNADVLDFIGWLRATNDTRRDDSTKVGFYGLDLYSMHASMEAVLTYLDTVDAEAARRARQRYACFDHFGGDPQHYGYAAASGLSPSCEREALSQLLDLNRSAADYVRRDGRAAADALFFATQNARLVRNAERYYRAMFSGRIDSWNLRDMHMAETLVELASFLDRGRSAARVVVWAHNSHLGDARATEMGDRGELNLGELVRARLPSESLLVGFSTYRGTVTAASDWDEPAQRMVVRDALPDSYESVMHEGRHSRFLIDFRSAATTVRDALRGPLLQRAIGVIYRPRTERLSHYFNARLSDQFDIVLHYDVTRAVEPLERTGQWERGELPETYPSAL